MYSLRRSRVYIFEKRNVLALFTCNFSIRLYRIQFVAKEQKTVNSVNQWKRQDFAVNLTSESDSRVVGGNYAFVCCFAVGWLKCGLLLSCWYRPTCGWSLLSFWLFCFLYRQWPNCPSTPTPLSCLTAADMFCWLKFGLDGLERISH